MHYCCTGYHGTLIENAHNILNSAFKLSRGRNTYLGDGAYFFENKSKKAVDFIICRNKEGTFGILKSKVKVKIENMLDLTTIEGTQIFHEHRERLLRAMRSHNIAAVIPQNKNIDGYVINDLHRYNPNLQAVRKKGYVRTYLDKLRNKGSSIPNACIICIRDVDNCIERTKLIEEGDIGELRRNLEKAR